MLHRTWKTHEALPIAFYRSIYSWGIEARFRDDADCRTDIAVLEPALQAVYDAMPHCIMRVDMWRYVVLLHLGGIYADLDVESTGPMDYLAAPGAHLVLEDLGARRRTVGNALMASSEPGHPFWRHVLDLVVKRAADLRDWGRLSPKGQRAAVLRTTGPYMLTDALDRWKGGGITVHEQAKSNAIHHRAGTWWR